MRSLLLPLARAALPLAAACALLRPLPARADTLDDYQRDNAALEALGDTRASLQQSIGQWARAEMQSQERLTQAESSLHDLLRDRQELQGRQPAQWQKAEDLRAAFSALDAQREALSRKVDDFESWLYGDAASPPSNNVRSYLSAREQLGDYVLAAQAVSGLADAAQGQYQDLVNQLGRDNTEITFWQRRAEALAGDVGSARDRALALSAQLADVQRQGNDLLPQVQAEFDMLRTVGHPVGVARISSGLEPIAEPAEWSANAPGYVLPAGKTDMTLVAAAPAASDLPQLRASGAIDGVTWQVPVTGIITTPYGDATPYQAAHYAIDIGTRLYTPVVAAADGVVEFAGLAAADNRLASYGLVVEIRHNEHLTSLYAHLDDRANGLAVRAGDQVAKGQIIGYVGLTGFSTGPHLHFEMRLDNHPFDPQLLVRP